MRGPGSPDGRARGRGVGGRVGAALRGGGADGRELALEGCEVWVGGDAGVVVGEGDKAVVIVAHEPFVDDAAAEDVRHVAVEDLHFGEGAVGWAPVDALDTPVFSEEDGHGVRGEEVDALAVRGGRVVAVAAPGVYVVAPEVDGSGVSGVAGLAGKVVCEFVAGGHVGCCIAHAQCAAVLLTGDVALGVADSCLDEGRSSRLVASAHVLIPSEEANDVLVLLQRIDDAGVSLVQCDIPLWVVGADRCRWLSKIGDNVDICAGELRHAVIVVFSRIDSIYAQNVGVDLLQVRDIAAAGVTVSERISVGRVGGGGAVGGVVLLVGHALEVTVRCQHCLRVSVTEGGRTHNCEPLFV